MNYEELKELQRTITNEQIFFAFNAKQLSEGIAKMPKGEKIYRGIGGMLGTKKGLLDFRASYDAITERIKKECTPEEIYNYEYINYECAYSGDDEEAVDIVQGYFKNWTPDGARATEKSKNAFEYSLLGRLQEDCKYFLGHGNRNEKHLWALSVPEQIKKMKELYNSFDVKPEWISLDDILNYEKEMTK